VFFEPLDIYRHFIKNDVLFYLYSKEVGAMNILFFFENKYIVTSALSDSVLPSITRDSILKLAPVLGFEVSE
jgi:branched-chain amino acid aminotransferase